jgi:L-threonylcarbamoyladenylate synthase
MKTDVMKSDHPAAITHAVDVLKNGGLVAFPTDTVYGLAAPYDNEESIDRLYIVKGRNSSKAISILISSFDELNKLTTQINQNAHIFAESFWPGPLTLVVPRHPELSDHLAPEQTIGVRVPDHPVALALLSKSGPLAVTSANRSGEKNPLNADDVLAQLEGRIHLVLNGGQSPGGVPSTVIDCTSLSFEILREGPISEKELQKALSK